MPPPSAVRRPAPALRGRRGSQLLGDAELNDGVLGQHRPSGVGEDRNQSQVPAMSSARCSQHRPSGVGEDRNITVRAIAAAHPAASTGLPGSARIATPRAVRTARGAQPSTGPPGSARIATACKTAPAKACRPASTGPPGSARIATPGSPPSSPPTASSLHRPSGVGEDRNPGYGPGVVCQQPRQHRPSGAGEDRNSSISRTRTRRSEPPAPALQVRRGSQHGHPADPAGRSLPAPALRGRRGS